MLKRRILKQQKKNQQCKETKCVTVHSQPNHRNFNKYVLKFKKYYAKIILIFKKTNMTILRIYTKNHKLKGENMITQIEELIALFYIFFNDFKNYS